MPASPSGLTIASASVGEVVLSFTGVPGVDGYDVYRSVVPEDIGVKINKVLIPQVGSPYSVTYVDNAANSVVPPVVPAYYFYRVVSVSIENGRINTVAGNGYWVVQGEGGQAASASLGWPTDVTFDSLGNFYIADWGGYIWKVDNTGIITRVAGNGQVGFFQEGNGPDVCIGIVTGVACDHLNNVYFCNGCMVGKLDVSTGMVSRFAGKDNFTAGYSGDGGPALDAYFKPIADIEFDSLGVLYISDWINARIRRIALDGNVYAFAGDGDSHDPYTGEGGPAMVATGIIPNQLAFDGSGNLFMTFPHRICKIEILTGIISTICGDETDAWSGDDGPAISAKLDFPYSLAFDLQGNLYISSSGDYGDTIRKIDISNIITTICGKDHQGYDGEGIFAKDSALYYPEGIEVDPLGQNLFIADSSNFRVRKIGLVSNYSDSIPSQSAMIGIALPQDVTPVQVILFSIEQRGN